MVSQSPMRLPGEQVSSVFFLWMCLPSQISGWLFAPWPAFSDESQESHEFLTCLVFSLVVRIGVRTNTQERCPFHYRGLECKSRKPRNTWSNRQIWPWNMEWSRAKTNRVLPRKCTGHSKHPLSITQEKSLHMDITRWSTPKLDWLCSLQPKMEKSIQSTKTWPGADCGSDYELLNTTFRLKLKKVGKITRPFRYDLNQIIMIYSGSEK